MSKKEYIERDAAINRLQEISNDYEYGGDMDAFYVADYCLHHMMELKPAADVEEVRHGWWLTKEYMYGDPDVGIEDMWVDRLAEQSDYYAYCSVCGKDAEYNAEGSLILSDYCPNCGAKMDGECKGGDGDE